MKHSKTHPKDGVPRHGAAAAFYGPGVVKISGDHSAPVSFRGGKRIHIGSNANVQFFHGVTEAPGGVVDMTGVSDTLSASMIKKCLDLSSDSDSSDEFAARSEKLMKGNGTKKQLPVKKQPPNVETKNESFDSMEEEALNAALEASKIEAEKDEELEDALEASKLEAKKLSKGKKGMSALSGNVPDGNADNNNGGEANNVDDSKVTKRRTTKRSTAGKKGNK